MEIKTRYNIGDEVILSGIVCDKIERIYVILDEDGRVQVNYRGPSSATMPFTDNDILCLKSEFLNVFGKQRSEAAPKPPAPVENFKGFSFEGACKCDKSNEADSKELKPEEEPPAAPVELDDPKAAKILSAASGSKNPVNPPSKEELEKFNALKKLAKQVSVTTISHVVKLAKRQEISYSSMDRCMQLTIGSTSLAAGGKCYPYIRRAFAEHFGLRLEQESE